jgi:hypothetical protein
MENLDNAQAGREVEAKSIPRRSAENVRRASGTRLHHIRGKASNQRDLMGATKIRIWRNWRGFGVVGCLLIKEEKGSLIIANLR